MLRWAAYAAIDLIILLGLAFVVTRWIVVSIFIFGHQLIFGQGQFRSCWWPPSLQAADYVGLEVDLSDSPVWRYTVSFDFGRGFNIEIPLWVPILFLVLPATWLSYLAFRPARRGHCQNCEYDLRGNTTGRCPECGTPRDDGKVQANEQLE